MHSGGGATDGIARVRQRISRRLHARDRDAVHVVSAGDARPIFDFEGRGHTGKPLRNYPVRHCRCFRVIIIRHKQGGKAKVTLHIKRATYRKKRVRSNDWVNRDTRHHGEHEQKCPAALAPATVTSDFETDESNFRHSEDQCTYIYAQTRIVFDNDVHHSVARRCVSTCTSKNLSRQSMILPEKLAA